jgi:hypothetical protein
MLDGAPLSITCSLCPVQERRQDALELAGSADSEKGTVLSPTTDPVGFGIHVRDLCKLTTLETGAGELNAHAPTGGVEGLDGYASLVLPISIAVGLIPVLEALESGEHDEESGGAV